VAYDALVGRTRVPVSDEARFAQSRDVAGPRVVVVVDVDVDVDVEVEVDVGDCFEQSSSARPAPSAAIEIADVAPARRRNSRRDDRSSLTWRRYSIGPDTFI
jgi:hypothetical protein